MICWFDLFEEYKDGQLFKGMSLKVRKLTVLVLHAIDDNNVILSVIYNYSN